MTGFYKSNPVIKKISFPSRTSMQIDLADGRKISFPLKCFPKIAKLNSNERKKWYVLDDQMFSFDDCNEIFHIEQVLGKENKYRYKFSKKSA